jgi:hypothetical protein
MATLHIQHPITDFETWTTAFNRFGEVRRNAGVQAQRIQRPVDNEKYVVIDLEFETVDTGRRSWAFCATRSGPVPRTRRAWRGRRRRWFSKRLRWAEGEAAGIELWEG